MDDSSDSGTGSESDVIPEQANCGEAAKLGTESLD
jgi:hypothetical protein